MSEAMSVAAALEGRGILLTGSTGFIGKVLTALLLDRSPELGRLYLLVRPRPGRETADRFFDIARGSPAFSALREAHGERFEAFLRERVEILPGDVTQPEFGLSPATVLALRGKIDLILNVAGLVAFNPGLDESLRINAYGACHGARLAVALGAKLVHMSTCYVAGCRSGDIKEDVEIDGYYPKKSPGGQAFSVDEELQDCGRTILAFERRAAGEMQATFREAALRRMAQKGKAATPEALVVAVTRQARRWLENRLREEGQSRAQRWGWPNIYCYTKALGEQMIARTPGLDYTIVRPSIVESSLRYPFPGWNEGLTTSAPVILAMCTGHALWPAHPKAALDVIPVDLVAAGTVAAAAAILQGRHQPVYHLSSSDTNPLRVRQCMRFVGEYRRRHYKDHAPDALWSHWLWTRLGVITVSVSVYRRFGVPAFRRAFSGLARLFSHPPQYVAAMERELSQVEHVVEMFLPFIHDIDCVFHTDNLRELYAAIPNADKDLFAWDPERIDWRRYWFDVHTAGLRRWVFPGFPGRNGGPLHPPDRPLINQALRGALDLGHGLVYGGLFDVEVRGNENIPASSGFIVASNHASHLDMGLVKHALGPAGDELVSLAARDYFFKNPALAFFFRSFTNLLPIGRSSSVKDALASAVAVLKQGRSLLVFPEATRSISGDTAPFKPTVGYLALQSRADVLPIYLEGTHAALAKGKILPRSRRLKAHIGAALAYAELNAKTKHLARKEAYRAATEMIQVAVRRLERGCSSASVVRAEASP